MATLALPDDPEGLVLILTAAANEIAEYLAADGLYRQLVVQAPGHTYHPTMTAGLVLDARRRVAALGRHLTPDQAQRARTAEAAIDGVLAGMTAAYGAKLRQEMSALTGSWGWYIDGCEHGDDDCADTYAQEVWLRTRLHDLIVEAARIGLEMGAEKAALDALDVRLRGVFSPGPYVGPADERGERDAATHWWLYGSARP